MTEQNKTTKGAFHRFLQQTQVYSTCENSCVISVVALREAFSSFNFFFFLPQMNLVITLLRCIMGTVVSSIFGA